MNENMQSYLDNKNILRNGFWCGRLYKIVTKKYEIEILITCMWFCRIYQTDKLMALKHAYNWDINYIIEF